MVGLHRAALRVRVGGIHYASVTHAANALGRPVGYVQRALDNGTEDEVTHIGAETWGKKLIERQLELEQKIKYLEDELDQLKEEVNCLT